MSLALTCPIRAGLQPAAAPQQQNALRTRRCFSSRPRRCSRLLVSAAEPAAADAPASAAEPSLDQLKRELQEAVKAEDYGAAAQLRDRIREVEAADPVARAEAELQQAVAEERWQDAARLRDELKELRPPPPPPPPAAPAPGYDPTAPTSSEQVTDGVRVQCRSFYVPSESRPAANAFFFSYQITISNESQDTIRLMERFWLITNGQGQSQEVKGAGVVGEQPVLEPGQSFTYQSACPLRTPKGTMEGHYEFYARDAASGQWTKSFLVNIGKFELRAEL